MVAALFSSVSELLEIIVAEEAKQRVRLVGDVANEVQVVRNKLKAITPVLQDAEDRMLTDRAITNWIDELRDAAYDLVDVLDELITTLRINGVGKTSNLKAKVGSYVARCFHSGQVVRRYDDLAFKFKEINDRLDAIGEERYRFNLIESSVLQHTRSDESTPSVHVSEIIGRDEVKGDILGSLLHESTEEDSELLKTISVIGMSGVGKTAVAQLVYQAEEVKQHFDDRIWVCVSDVFNEKNVAKAIIAKVELAAVDSLDSFPLVTLHERIRRSIEGKKFFLVLDDVWTDDMRHWEALIQTFKHGVPGSRILLTTCQDRVANMMKYSHVFPLRPLSDEHCWMVLSQTAFIGRGVEECQNLEGIGKKISKKCQGLPLAAKTLGGLLRFKSNMAEWENILNSEIWNLDIVGGVKFVSLLLSYYNLPSPLRECFKYCAVFPKDFVYDGETIIYHWMAQGYLGLNNDEDLELKGREYISHLAARSFFRDFMLDTDGLKSTWKMDDIMHDFAMFLMKNDGIVVKVNPGGNSTIDLFSQKPCYKSQKPRYLTALIPEGCCLPTINGAEKLRSLVIISRENAVTNEAVQFIFNQAEWLRLVDFGCHNALEDTIPKEIGNWIHLRHVTLSGSKIKGLSRSLCELHNLQYLNLNNCEYLENLPDEIGNLIHLRHINFSGSKIKGLPGSLCELHNLQYLKLHNCKSLENLPNEIGNLINLIYLGTLHCDKLACYPKSARRLTNLMQLCGIVLRADRNDLKEFALGDLENLNHLRELSMVVKGNAVDDRELRRAKFENKTHLKEIEVE